MKETNDKAVHPGNFERFMEVYAENLRKSHSENPELYLWSIEDFGEVLKRMSFAIMKGTFNKDSHALKATCRELGIKRTYEAIREFIQL